MIWLGDKRGNLSDWTTQQWVKATGRRVALSDHPWLDGPVGPTRQIGLGYFEQYAERKNLKIIESGTRGEEEIRVYAAEPGIVRADHTLWIWGVRFLRLHYRMQKAST